MNHNQPCKAVFVPSGPFPADKVNREEIPLGEFLEETGMQQNGTRSAVARELGFFVLIDFVMERMP